MEKVKLRTLIEDYNKKCTLNTTSLAEVMKGNFPWDKDRSGTEPY